MIEKRLNYSQPSKYEREKSTQALIFLTIVLSMYL